MPAKLKVPALVKAFFAPQPLVRLEFLRILIPLAILGFLSSRLSYPGEWLTDRGFQIPDLGHRDWRQPLYIPPLPLWGAITLCALTTLSGLLVSLGYRTRMALVAFALCLIYLALADRLAAFTVSKLGAVLAVALCFTPCGNAFGLDAWLANDKKGKNPSAHPLPAVTWGNVRFFQVLVALLYLASGLAKIHGDWFQVHDVLWTHVHDSYQTLTSYRVARALPYRVWPYLQYLVLAFETGAPLWFLLPWTRLPALWVGLGMHTFIGLCFGPVIWFALLMMVLLLGCFAPLAWLERLLRLRLKPD
ncbi:MAG: hypothetical protein JWO30_833 [Fibrobacteres bacterium]|nr:hypothetical protein [Fibrobacterota bacterium]